MMRLLPIALILFTSVAIASEVYTWRDENGVLHYGDKPLADDARRVVIETRRTNPSAVTARATERQADLAEASEEFQARRNDERAAAEAARIAAEEKQQACSEARDRLRAYINARRLYRQGDDGEPVYLSSEEIDQARQDAERAVADRCS
ncbi:MAG: DUF4124 domain-containing protein [Pseudomonadota bacterium]